MVGMKASFLRYIFLLFLSMLLIACGLPLFNPVSTPQQAQNHIRTPSVAVTPSLEGLSLTPSEGSLADLAYYYYSIEYDACPWDGPGSITVRVNNIGTGDAGPFDVTINGQKAHVYGIPAGESADAVVRFDSGPIGGVEIEIDPGNQVMESDKENNRFFIVFTPPPPCLTDTP
jgi:hypothetical protein